MSEQIAFRRKHRVPSRGTSPYLIIGIAAFVVVFGLVVWRFSGTPPTRSTDMPAVAEIQNSTDSITSSRQNALVIAAEKVGPAVVNIGVVTTRVVRGRNPMYDDFFDSFFRDFLPPTYYQRREEIPNIGSGVIVSPNGYIVTNYHVIQGAEKITIGTPDGRTLPGTVAGMHEASDIAILKVDAEGLPYAPLGDSDDLMIGEWAIAIGNPFGSLIEDAHPSVTVGVISAWKRAFKPREGGQIYDDMIQTDAAINPGNSGGPLVNAEGEVIGINTFILSSSGGSLGIGFAIPINRVKKMLAEVEHYGTVRRPWLGFTVLNVDDQTARSLGLPAEGAVVNSVDLNSSADEAGLKPGDVIIRVNGRVVRSADNVASAFGSVLVGESFTIDLLRKEEELRVTLIAREAP